MPYILFTQDFSDPQKFEIIESLQTVDGKPSYAKAVHAGLDYYNSHKRSDARGVFIIVGDGESTDKQEERSLASNLVRKAKGLECHAVHSGKEINEKTLKAFTGDAKRVYNYDRNADFAKELLRLATLGQTEQCVEARKQIHVQASSDKNNNEKEEQTYSTSEPFVAAARQRLRDISGPLKNGLDIEKVVAIQKTTLRRFETTTPISTTKTTTTENPKTEISTKLSTKAPSATVETTKKSKAKSTATVSTTEGIKTTTSKPTKLPKALKAASELLDAPEKKKSKTTTQTPTFETTTDSTITKALKKSKTTKIPKTTTTEASTTAAPKTTISQAPKLLTPTPKSIPLNPTTSFPFEVSTRHVPGCLIDLLIIIDSSGSVEATFNREKELISGVLDKLRIGSENARVSLIKFAATEKVRTIVPFDGPQSKLYLMKSLERIPFSSGTTAIHSALLHAISEYSPLKGARPGKAAPIAIIFTDGFAQRDTTKESALLRQAIPDLYAVAINHDYPISRVELEKITGDPRRVFTDINDLHRILSPKFRSC
uniref:VWFA domain-containing protein n=1 Tax=Panagrolaimus superbus TaxID=310955 RepID=A0A914YR28_9BILA